MGLTVYFSLLRVIKRNTNADFTKEYYDNLYNQVFEKFGCKKNEKDKHIRDIFDKLNEYFTQLHINDELILKGQLVFIKYDLMSGNEHKIIESINSLRELNRRYISSGTGVKNVLSDEDLVMWLENEKLIDVIYNENTSPSVMDKSEEIITLLYREDKLPDSVLKSFFKSIDNESTLKIIKNLIRISNHEQCEKIFNIIKSNFSISCINLFKILMNRVANPHHVIYNSHIVIEDPKLLSTNEKKDIINNYDSLHIIPFILDCLLNPDYSIEMESKLILALNKCIGLFSLDKYKIYQALYSQLETVIANVPNNKYCIIMEYFYKIYSKCTWFKEEKTNVNDILKEKFKSYYDMVNGENINQDEHITIIEHYSKIIFNVSEDLHESYEYFVNIIHEKGIFKKELDTFYSVLTEGIKENYENVDNEVIEKMIKSLLKIEFNGYDISEKIMDYYYTYILLY